MADKAEEKTKKKDRQGKKKLFKIQKQLTKQDFFIKIFHVLFKFRS